MNQFIRPGWASRLVSLVLRRANRAALPVHSVAAAETAPSTLTQQVVSWLSPAEAAEMGAFPPEAIIGMVHGPDALPSLINFTGNSIFRAFLQAQLQRLGPEIPEICWAAKKQGTGYVYVFDGRVEAYLQADPDTDVPMADILGAFPVRNGIIRSEDYWGNPDHALLGERGICKIPRHFRAGMLEALRHSWLKSD